MNEKLGQQPAFATSAFGDGEGVYDPGMSTRLYIATMAMQGMLSNPNRELRYDNVENFIKNCYEYADELLKQENE